MTFIQIKSSEQRGKVRALLFQRQVNWVSWIRDRAHYLVVRWTHQLSTSTMQGTESKITIMIFITLENCVVFNVRL